MEKDVTLNSLSESYLNILCRPIAASAAQKSYALHFTLCVRTDREGI